MKSALFATSVLFLFIAYPSGPLAAQFGASGFAGEDRITIGLFGGQLNPGTTYRDGSGFDSAGMLGGHVTVWLHRHLGINADFSSATTTGLDAESGGVSIVTDADPRTRLVLGDVRARFPVLESPGFSLAPYLGAGAGVKHYAFQRQGVFDALRGAWTVVGGSEVRFGQNGRFGLRGDVRNVWSRFDLFGEDQTQSDLRWSAGVIMTL